MAAAAVEVLHALKKVYAAKPPTKAIPILKSIGILDFVVTATNSINIHPEIPPAIVQAVCITTSSKMCLF